MNKINRYFNYSEAPLDRWLATGITLLNDMPRIKSCIKALNFTHRQYIIARIWYTIEI